MALEPICGRRFAEHSYGFRPGRSCRDALRRVNGQLAGGRTHVVGIGIQGYFDTIDQGVRMRLRSIHRKRHRGRGRGRNHDHALWPNRRLTELGLLSLEAAQGEATSLRKGVKH